MAADLHFGTRTLTAAEQADRGSRLAGGLLAAGLRAGDVVAVLLRNGVVCVDVIHACRRAGIAYAPINWHFTAAEAGVVLHDSGAKLLIGDADLLAAVADAVPAGLRVIAVGADDDDASGYERWLAAQPPYAGPEVAPRAHMAFTSGTSGRPKGVLRAPVPLAELPAQRQRIDCLLALALGVTPQCRALLPAPLYHSACAVFMQQALQVAASVRLEPRFDAEAVLAAIERDRIDVVYLVPVMYVRLLRLPPAVRTRYDVSSLRFVASTGAPCAPDVKRAMIDWFGPVIHETYASSEAGLVTAIDSAQSLAKPGSAGLPLLDAEVRILHDDATPCAPGEVGLVYVRQPAYPDFRYVGNDAARRAIDVDGLVTLGDLGYLDEDGFLFVCDRASDMVISGGVNIYPAETEHALLAVPGVADCAVFGVPDDEFGERLHAVVEVQPGATFDPAGADALLRSRLAAYKVPRTIAIGALPRDDNGKIAKRRLRDAFWVGRARRV